MDFSGKYGSLSTHAQLSKAPLLSEPFTNPADQEMELPLPNFESACYKARDIELFLTLT